MMKTIKNWSGADVCEFFWRDKYGTTGKTVLDMVGFFRYAGPAKVKHLIKHHISIATEYADPDKYQITPEEVRDDMAAWLEAYLAGKYGEDWRECGVLDAMKRTLGANMYIDALNTLQAHQF